jgi:hypothetical protein
LVQFLGIESSNMILKIFRTATFHPKFLESLKQAYEKFDASAGYSYTNQFRTYLAKWRSYSQEELLKLMTPSEVFGDEK